MNQDQINRQRLVNKLTLLSFVYLSLFAPALITLLYLYFFGLPETIYFGGIYSLYIYLFEIKDSGNSTALNKKLVIAFRSFFRKFSKKIEPTTNPNIHIKVDKFFHKHGMINYQFGNFLINMSLIGYSMYSDEWQIFFIAPILIHLLVIKEVWKISAT